MFKSQKVIIGEKIGMWGDWKLFPQRINLDGFVKSQIGSLRCPLSGVSTPAAKFQELVASSSNSLEFLTPPVSKPFFRKRQCRSPIRLFTRLLNFTVSDAIMQRTEDRLTMQNADFYPLVSVFWHLTSQQSTGKWILEHRVNLRNGRVRSRSLSVPCLQ